MSEAAGTPDSKRHSLSDWLTLHQLDPATCRRILNAAPEAREPASDLGSDYPDVAAEIVWLQAVEAMHDLLPAQRGVIDDTYANSAKILDDRDSKPAKSFTVDNGPGTYPTIVYRYRGAPADALVFAHEFAHAVQIRATGGPFVAPVVRETCAFLGEIAFLSRSQRSGAAGHAHLLGAWEKANARYFGRLTAQLDADLSSPNTPYNYAWNYPLARTLAIWISDRGSPEWIWSLFEGTIDVPAILLKLDI